MATKNKATESPEANGTDQQHSAAPSMTIAKKITSRTFHEVIDIAHLQKVGTMELYRVIGIARATVTGNSTFGPWVAIVGDFMATDSVTGDQVRAPRVILPSMANELVYGRLDGDNAVEFGFIIGVKFDKSTPTKYSYTVTPMMQPAQNDPLMQLKARIETGNLLENKG